MASASPINHIQPNLPLENPNLFSTCCNWQNRSVRDLEGGQIHACCEKLIKVGKIGATISAVSSVFGLIGGLFRAFITKYAEKQALGYVAVVNANESVARYFAEGFLYTFAIVFTIIALSCVINHCKRPSH